MTDIIDRLNAWPATGNGDGLDAAVVSALMKEAAAALEQAHRSRDGWIDVNEAAGKGLVAMHTKVERLTAALAFYRDGFKPRVTSKSGLTYHPTEALLDDCGNKAREALAAGQQQAPEKSK